MFLAASLPASTTLHDQLCLAVRAVLARAPEAPFALRRVRVAASDARGAVGGALQQVLRRLEASDVGGADWTDSLASALVRAGGALEQARDPAGARALFELASELRPSCATTKLHAGRASREAGDSAAALEHYASARALDEGGRVARLARIGEAMLSSGSERRLSEEIRQAVRAGDREAAGVGLEARATVRCATARCREAIRDLCVCALRYPDREDQARAAERVAALLIESHDPHAAREALLLVHAIGTPAQRAGARRKLHAVSVALGDVLGARRWSGGEAVGVDSNARATAQAPTPSVPRVSLPVIRDWRNAVERTAGAT
jgi:hypothetical protein